MYRLAKILSEIKPSPSVTPDMVKDIYDSILEDAQNFNIFAIDNIMSKHNLSDLYRYDLFAKINKLDPKSLIALYKDLLSYKKSLEK